MTAIRIDLRGVAYRDNQWWIAHCLEMDVVAEGDTPQEAIKDLIGLCDLKIADAIKEGDIKSVFRPAPPEIWDLYAKATKTPLRRALPRRVSRFEMRALELV